MMVKETDFLAVLSNHLERDGLDPTAAVAWTLVVVNDPEQLRYELGPFHARAVLGLKDRTPGHRCMMDVVRAVVVYERRRQAT